MEVTLREDVKEVKEWASSHGEEEHSRQREQSVQRPWDGPGVCAEQPGLRAALVSAGREQKDMEADSEAPAGVVRNLAFTLSEKAGYQMPRRGVPVHSGLQVWTGSASSGRRSRRQPAT